MFGTRHDEIQGVAVQNKGEAASHDISETWNGINIQQTSPCTFRTPASNII
jgi:hypothetical protein